MVCKWEKKNKKNKNEQIIMIADKGKMLLIFEGVGFLVGGMFLFSFFFFAFCLLCFESILTTLSWLVTSHHTASKTSFSV